jgi:hypothetical protein
MNKFQATFADGTVITRGTEREYGAAWRATWTRDGHKCHREGFAASKEKVAAYTPSATFVTRFMSSNERAKARARNAAYLVEIGYAVEIVETVEI